MRRNLRERLTEEVLPMLKPGRRPDPPKPLEKAKWRRVFLGRNRLELRFLGGTAYVERAYPSAGRRQWRFNAHTDPIMREGYTALSVSSDLLFTQQDAMTLAREAAAAILEVRRQAVTLGSLPRKPKGPIAA